MNETFGPDSSWFVVLIHSQIVSLHAEEVEQIVQLLLVSVHRKDCSKQLLCAHYRGTYATI